VFGGAHAQALLDVVIEVADGDAGHGGAPVPGTGLIVIDDCNAINEVGRQFEKAAKSIFALSDEQIRQLIENGQFEEVNKNG